MKSNQDQKEVKKEGKLKKFFNKLFGVEKLMNMTQSERREYMAKMDNIFLGLFFALGLYQLFFGFLDLFLRDWLGAIQNFIIAFWIFMYGDSISKRQEGWNLASEVIENWGKSVDSMGEIITKLAKENIKLKEQNIKLKKNEK